MDSTRDAALQRATTVLRKSLETQAGLPTDDAIIELRLALRSAFRVLSVPYTRIVEERENQ